jgi:hypothetical protein
MTEESDDDDDDDDVIPKHVAAITYCNKERKSYVGDQTHQFGMKVHNVVHLLCLQHYGITFLVFSHYSAVTLHSVDQ